MPGLLAIIGADSRPFKRELDGVEAMARRSGQRMRVDLAAERAKAARGAAGGMSSQASFEAIVLLRELGRGNFSRIPGSLSLMLQRLGLMKYLLNPIVGIVAGLAIGFEAARKQAAYLVDKLQSLKVPDFNPEPIARYKQAINEAAEAQAAINREVAHTVEEYNSAAEAAKRAADATREHYEHLRKMNELSDKSPAQKATALAEIDKQERAAELQNKFTEQTALINEQIAKKRQADAIRVPSADEEKERIEFLKKKSDASLEFLKKNNMTVKEGSYEDLMQLYTVLSASGVNNSDLKKSAAEKVKEAAGNVKAYRDALDVQHDNELARQRQEQLNKESGDAAKQAAQLGLQISDFQKLNDQKNQDAQEELAATLRGDRKKEHFSVNALQKVGAYTPPAFVVDVQRKMLGELAQINKNTATMAGAYRQPSVSRLQH